MSAANNLIVLIPGFLGFDQFGDFRYFRATVSDELRRGFAALPEKPHVDINAVTTDPAGTLAYRQQQLLAQLHAFVREKPGVRLHLLGHSTGGLDAELLLCMPLLATSTTCQRQAEAVLPAIASITTLAAPLAGTSISDAPIARLFALHGRQDFFAALKSKLFYRAPGVWFRLGFDLLALLRSDAAVGELLHGALQDRDALARYLLNLILRRSLATDLSPAAVGRVLGQLSINGAYAEVPRTRFVSIARVERKASPEGLLFQDFYDNTAAAARDDASVRAVAEALAAGMKKATIRVIGSPPIPTSIDFRDNDGIVNTTRQLFPASFAPPELELSRVAAVVIADHLDVVGYYQGRDGQPSGFLSSGSNFRDREFNALYREIAARIASALE